MRRGRCSKALPLVAVSLSCIVFLLIWMSGWTITKPQTGQRMTELIHIGTRIWTSFDGNLGTSTTNKSETNPTNKSGTHPTNKSGTHPTNKSGTKPTNKSGTNPTDKSGTNPTNTSGTNPTNKSVTKPTNKSGTNPTDKSETNPTNTSGTNPTNKSGTNPTNKSGTNPTNKSGTNEMIDKEWRYNESMLVGDIVQGRITRLQYPKNCSTARLLICKYPSHGFGCRMHSLMGCLMVGYITQRTVVAVPEFSKHLKPLSAPCTGYNVSNAPSWSPSITKPQALVLRDNKTRHSLDVPTLQKDLKQRIDKFHETPFVWWAGQFARYVFQPNNKTVQFLGDEERRIWFSHPIVGVHVRRTDKRIEAKFYSVEEYMVHVESWYNELAKSIPEVQRKVFLATDEPKVASEIIAKYPNYTFLHNGNVSSVANPKLRRTDDGELGIIHDIHMLSKCDFVVCTLSSNVCRVVYELMQTRYGDGSRNVVSVDNIYNYPIAVAIRMKFTREELNNLKMTQPNLTVS